MSESDIKESKEYRSALSSMQHICSRRECCKADIKRYLQKRNLTMQQQDSLINKLIEERFLDEMRYATAFVKDKSRFNGWGEVKISWALKSKGVPEQIISKALNELSLEEQKDRVKILLEKKLPSYLKSGDSSTIKARLIRFALSRGYRSEIIYPVVNEILGNFEV